MAGDPEFSIFHLTSGVGITFLLLIVLALIVQAISLSIKVAEKIHSARELYRTFKTYKNEMLVGVLSSILCYSRLQQEKRITTLKSTPVKGRVHNYWSLAGRFEHNDFISSARNWLNGLDWTSLPKVKFSNKGYVKDAPKKEGQGRI